VYDYGAGSGWSQGVDQDDSDKFKISHGSAFKPGTGDIVTVTTGGQVGIGTTNPGVKLEVKEGSVLVERDGSSVSPGSWPTVAGLRVLTWAGDGPSTDTGIALLDISAGRVNSSDTYAGNAYMIRIAADDGVNAWFKADGNAYIRGNVGIGTTSPSYKLDVNGSIAGTGITLTGTAPIGFYGNGQSGTFNRTVLYMHQNNTSGNNANGYFIERGRITDSGSAEVRYFTIGARGGQVQFTIDGTGNVIAAGNVTAYGSPSDIKFKKNINTLTNALATIQQLRGVTFEWKEDSEVHTMTQMTNDIGFIAQEVQQILPDLVRDDGRGTLSLRERAIVPLLVEAIKELKKQLDEVKSQKH
jgi:hypothetical protein